MRKKNTSKKLFAIYKNGIHTGNSYGFDELDALRVYFEKANLYFDKDILKKYKAVYAIEDIHFFKSEYVNIS